MNKYEELENEAFQNNVEIIEYPFNSERIKGLYCDRIVALSNTLDTSQEKACVRAEELGHYYTSSGDILNLSDVQNRKQEVRARAWAYDRQIGLAGIIECFKAGCQTLVEMAEYLEVTEDFLMEALERYRQKYGEYTIVDHYIIYFDPLLMVAEILSAEHE